MKVEFIIMINGALILRDLVFYKAKHAQSHLTLQLPLLVKTIARILDVSGWINVLRNTYSTVELLGRAARTSGSSSDNVFSEECDSNAWATSFKYEPRRVHWNHPHEDSMKPVVIGADRLRNSHWYLIYCAIYYYLAWKSDKARVQSAAVRHR